MYMDATLTRTIPCDGRWYPIFKADYNTITKGKGLQADGTFGFPAAAKDVEARLYINVSGSLAEGERTGMFEIQAVRQGTTNDTANLDRLVRARDKTGFYMARHTHPLWVGTNPRGLRWEIRSTPELGLRIMILKTRHVKHVGRAVIH